MKTNKKYKITNLYKIINETEKNYVIIIKIILLL